MAKLRKHWTEMSPDEIDAAAANEEGAMSRAAACALFAAENARVAAGSEYRRLMAVPDHLELTDAEFYAKAGVSDAMQWQQHIIADDREVVLGRVARQLVDKYVEKAIAAGVSVAEVMVGLTISPELRPFIEKELYIYNEVAFAPYYDSLAVQLEGELNYNFVREVA